MEQTELIIVDALDRIDKTIYDSPIPRMRADNSLRIVNSDDISDMISDIKTQLPAEIRRANTILLQMDEDGTGYLDYGDRRDSFTWDEEGIFLNGVKLLYSIRKDTLRIGVNDQEMLFTRR